MTADLDAHMFVGGGASRRITHRRPDGRWQQWCPMTRWDLSIPGRVELPGNKMTGDGLPLLLDLVDRGIIRILDLVFVRKETDGPLPLSRSPTSTETASSTWPSSKAPRPDC